jgi:hypothetical protein
MTEIQFGMPFAHHTLGFGKAPYVKNNVELKFFKP